MRIWLVLSLVIAASASVQSQTTWTPGAGLQSLVDANEHFGRRLLYQIHVASPDRNVAISPLPLTLSFAAFSADSVLMRETDELEKAFSFPIWQLDEPVRLLAFAFRKPQLSASAPKPSAAHPRAKLQAAPVIPKDEVWTNTGLWYPRGLFSTSFTQRAKTFGIDLYPVSATEPPADALHRSWKAPLSLPPIQRGASDFIFVNQTHVRSRWWYFGDFQKHEFVLRSGVREQVGMLTSSARVLPYAQNEQFEVVALPCGRVYMLVLLPRQGEDILEIEKALTSEGTDLNVLMQSQLGEVSLPKFKIINDQLELRTPLEEMGIRAVFHDFRSFEHGIDAGGVLEHVVQKIAVDVNRDGISADAITIMQGVPGGIAGPGQKPPEPFKMIVDRPFLFFIRDNITNTLLFSGVVMDPNQH